MYFSDQIPLAGCSPFNTQLKSVHSKFNKLGLLAIDYYGLATCVNFTIHKLNETNKTAELSDLASPSRLGRGGEQKRVKRFGPIERMPVLLLSVYRLSI